MNEMLANQYLITERFLEASELYKKVLSVKPKNSFVKKKLLNCFLLSGKINEAMDILKQFSKRDFEKFLEDNDNLFIPPCKKMIYEIESGISNLSEIEELSALSMLWINCNIYVAKSYFEQLGLMFPKDNQLRKVLTLINNSLS